MKIMAVNGSPRGKWNTATLLNKALEGAASQGAETKFIHLNDLNFKGCQSCFSCKKRGGKSYGKCAWKDELTPILESIRETDAIILGSPIYMGTVSGVMKLFMERLCFSSLAYTKPISSLFPKKIRSGFIYTMNNTIESAIKQGVDKYILRNEEVFKILFGHSESLSAMDTLQFDDYSRVVADRFDSEAKIRRRKEVFPEDCRKAFEMGVNFVQ